MSLTRRAGRTPASASLARRAILADILGLTIVIQAASSPTPAATVPGNAVDAPESGPPSASTQPRRRLACTLEGRVLDSAGRGMVDVRVVASQSRLEPNEAGEVEYVGKSYSGVSRDDGAYRIEGVPAGRKTSVSLQLPGRDVYEHHGPHRPAESVFEPGFRPNEPVVRGLDFRVYRPATIRGIVYGPDGEPLAGTHVEVLDHSHSSGTDEQGRFKFDQLFPDRPLTVVVKHDRAATFVSDPMTIDEGGSTEVVARLTTGGAVRGRLRLRDGKTVFGDSLQPQLRFMPQGRMHRRLVLREREEQPPGSPCIITRAPPSPDKDGSFRVEHLPAGHVDLHVTAWLDCTPAGTKPDSMSARHSRETPPEFVSRIPPNLREAFPVIKYPVLLFATVRGIEVREGRTTDIGDIWYEQPGRLTGRVTDDRGEPADGAAVYLTLTEMERFGMMDADHENFLIDTVMTRTDADGRYAFDQLCRGPRLIWAGRFDADDAAKLGVDMAGRASVELDLRLRGAAAEEPSRPRERTTP